MTTFMEIFNKPSELRDFLQKNNITCIRYDILDGGQIMALFNRTAEVMLKYYDGTIFYQGDNNYWDIARAIEDQIIDENRDILLSIYNINLEEDIQEMREDFMSDHFEEDSYDKNNVNDELLNKIMIKDLSDSYNVMWTERNQEYYYDLIHLFEI